MVIKGMLEKMLSSHGTEVIRIGFSSVIKCVCTSKAEGNSMCDICLGTGYRSAVKKDKIIIDTFMERQNITEKSTGNYQNVSVRLYSKSKIKEGEFIYHKNAKELFKVGSVYIERFGNGDDEAYISGATRTNELLYVIDNINVDLVSDRWCLYQEVINNRNI